MVVEDDHHHCDHNYEDIIIIAPNIYGLNTLHALIC